MANEKRHIRQEDFGEIIDILQKMLVSNTFETMHKKLYAIFISIIELQPTPFLPPLGIWKKEKVLNMRKSIIADMIEAAKNENCKKLVYLFSKLY